VSEKPGAVHRLAIDQSETCMTIRFTKDTVLSKQYEILCVVRPIEAIRAAWDELVNSAIRTRSEASTPFCVNFLMEAGWPRLGARRSEGSSPSGADHRAASLYSVDRCESDHDAAMRIGGEAPGGTP
jgi:hypothetical protein